MKKTYSLLLMLNMLLFSAAHAQDTAYTHMFRVYEDNDCLNLTAKLTDNAYTNGTRLEYYYTKKDTKFFLDRWMPKAGKNSIDVYGLSVAQLMNTPDDLADPDFQSNDYPYSGALFVTHSLRSYNPVKKYDFQTELLAGVMGPDAFTRQSQTFIHEMIGCQHPMGWGNQFKNAALLNLNLSAEKELISYRNVLDIIGGGQVMGGTMTDATNVYSIIRIGNISPYFNGYIGQYAGTKKKMQAYLFAKPGIEYVFRNALLQGGTFTTAPVVKNIETDYLPVKEQSPAIENVVAYISYGVTVGYDRFSLSYSETTNSPTMVGLYGHTVGNISVCYSW